MKKIEKVKISIQGGGLSYQGELDQKVAGQIVALCLSSMVSQDGSQAYPEVISKNPNATESASEYYNRYSPTRNPDKILTLAGYIKNVRGSDSFHPNEIKSLLRDVAEVLPANFTRDIKSTIKLGWIAPDPAKKKNFYVTNTGFKILLEGFPKELSESVYKNGSKKKINK